MAEMAKQQAVNLWVQDQSSFQCSFGQPKNAMDVINMAEKSNEDRNKFEINDDISIDNSGSFQCSFGQKIVENAKEVANVAEKSNEEHPYKFNFEDVHENTSNQALAAPQSKFSSPIFLIASTRHHLILKEAYLFKCQTFCCVCRAHGI
jgi:hypothetical protein